MTTKTMQRNELAGRSAMGKAIEQGMKKAMRTGVALSLLMGAITAQATTDVNGVPSNAFDYTRTKSFTYNADGTLATATTEPNTPADCSVSSVTYDNYGNATSTTVANCAGATNLQLFASRQSGVTYNTANSSIVAGLFPASATNALGQTETRQYEARFGAMTQRTDPNLLTSQIVIDDFGRKTTDIAPDQTRTFTAYCILSGLGLDTSTNSAECSTIAVPASGEAPTYAVRYTHVETRDTNDVKMGPFVRTWYDKLGRVIRTATESYDGPNQPSAKSGAIVVADTVYDAYGSKTLVTSPYFLSSGSTTSSGSNDVGVTKYVYDELGRSTAAYNTDPNGSQASITFGSTGTVAYGRYGSRVAAVSTFSYSGLTTTTTNDKGQVRTEEKSARGDILRITDNTGAQIAYSPDAFGNIVQTKDALQNSIANRYDLLGHEVQMTDPDKGVIFTCYDPLGQAKADQTSAMRVSDTPPSSCPAITASGTTAMAAAHWTTLAYDQLGRLTDRIEPDDESSWSYDHYADNSACNKGIGKLCESKTNIGVDKKITYDNWGRMITSVEAVTSGPTFTSQVGYEVATGRLSTRTYPTGLQVQYNYTARGYASTLTLNTAATVAPLPDANNNTATGTTLAAGTILWQAMVVDAQGRIEQEQKGNGVNAVTDTTQYDPATGHITQVTGGKGAATDILSQQYAWDSIGNLQNRTDANGNGVTAISEAFTYDSDNRLAQYTVASTGIPGMTRTVNLYYNAAGEMLYKSDVGNYVYPAGGSGHQHALLQLQGASTVTYGIDWDGNVVAASGGQYTSLAYSSFDNVVTAAGPNASYSWTYDENHQRVKETRTSGSNTRTIWYLHPDNVGGLGFEQETDSATTHTTSNRHFLSVGSESIGVLVSTGNAVSNSITLVRVEYWHKDHLGSIASTTDHLGNLTQRYSYDPFGKRRITDGEYDQNNTVNGDWNPDRNYGTGRGFTGHEELNDIGIVNMNGRIYDDTAGRFIQADPHVTDPTNMQNYNRYAYVMNNPLNATDPSGFDTDSFTQHNTTEGGFLEKLTSWVKGFFGGSSSPNGAPANSDSSSSGLDTANLKVDETVKVQGKLPPTHLEPGAEFDYNRLAYEQGMPGSSNGEAGTGIIYRRTGPNGECYIGQACNEKRYQERQKEHDKATGRKNTFEKIEEKVDKDKLNVREEDNIRKGGGPKSQGGTLENGRYQMSEKRYREQGGSVNKPTGPSRSTPSEAEPSSVPEPVPVAEPVPEAVPEGEVFEILELIEQTLQEL